jgi:transposase
MYQLDYVSLIQEDADTLLAREKACHQSKPRQRLQMLRLLKSGQAENIPQVATMVGMSNGNATQLFKRYREHGLEALVETKYKGRRSRLCAEQEHILQSEGAPHFRTLREATIWVAEQFKVQYTLAGMSVLFERIGVKKKTGRTTHHKHDPVAQEAYKKNS